METIIKTQQVKLTATSGTSIQTSSFWQQAEANRFGIFPILLVAVACMGGIAAGFGARGDMFRIGLVAFPTIITLSLMLAVAPMRLIIWSSVTAVLIQMAVLIF